MEYSIKLQINKKLGDVKSAIFAVADSLNFYIQPDSLKNLNVPKLADQIVANTRKQFGEHYTKSNLETILNQTIENMTTTTTAKSAKVAVAPKSEIELTDADLKIINSADSFNKRISLLPHLWPHPAVLMKAFGKQRQRVLNAIDIAKKKAK